MIKRLDDGKAPATVHMEKTVAQTMVTKAFDNGKVAGDALRPFRRVKRVLKKGSNARKRVLSVQEYIDLLNASQEHLRPILIIGMNTGMRIGEILNLGWANIDRKSGFIRLRSGDTKEGMQKSIPTNHHVDTVLNNTVQHMHHDVVFTFRHKPITKVYKSLKAACDKAGIEYGRKKQNGITFHDIRRTVKTNMLNSGVDKIFRDCILGHSHDGMDAHYMAPSDDDLQRAMERYTMWFDKMVTKLKSVDHNVDQEQKKAKGKYIN
jgi:integrase